MKSPEVSELEVLGMTGSGACGRVYRARQADGRDVAVKVFHEAGVNRALLEQAALRLEEGGWPEGVLEEISEDYRGKQILRVTPWLADEVDGRVMPRSLQHRLHLFPGEESWPLVIQILRALTAMHQRQVAHGNLKPGNVFFDHDERVVLTDWALGNMPGVEAIDYTDAVLYQGPDQLRDPGGYLREKGYRWDVHAFAVLAYRLVTGAFPRCTATFDEVAPEPGRTRREGISANLRSIARMVEAQPVVTWPDPPANLLEEKYRGHLDACLSLDPAARPANAGEVLAMFERSRQEIEQEMQRDAVLDQHRRARRSAWRGNVLAGVMAGAAAVFCLLWKVKVAELDAEERGRSADLSRVDAARIVADEARKKAEETLEAERKELQYEKDLWLSRLESSRSIGDHLFAWAMEKGHRKLPPLDGRDQRLTRLEKYFQDFIIRTAPIEPLKEERARAKLQLAEVSLARGDAKVAAERLKDAMDSSADLPAGPDLDLRLATDRLLLALLLEEKSDPAAAEAFISARQALEAVPQAETDADRVQQLLAVLDFHESRLLAAASRDNEALERLHRATQSLSRLSAQRPDAVVLRSELARCFLDSATILDGIGEMGSAREVRAMASQELLRLLEKDPGNLDLRLELAGCYGGMAEASLLSGDVANAESMSKGAVKILEELVQQMPDRADVRSMLAAQHGLMAGILRDRGEAAEARRLVDSAIVLVENVAVGESSNPVARYRLAHLLWQKGLMQGAAGNRESEITLETRAAELLRKLLESDDSGQLREEQVRRTLGYVLGDLGHSSQLAGKPELAQAAFGEAVAVWTQLNRERPNTEEYKEGLAWCRQRLEEL